jgi:hypothetical protein
LAEKFGGQSARHEHVCGEDSSHSPVHRVLR